MEILKTILMVLGAAVVLFLVWDFTTAWINRMIDAKIEEQQKIGKDNIETLFHRHGCLKMMYEDHERRLKVWEKQVEKILSRTSTADNLHRSPLDRKFYGLAPQDVELCYKIYKASPTFPSQEEIEQELRQLRELSLQALISHLQKFSGEKSKNTQ
ncbi:MAG: hypothetical protein AB7V08_08630 [Elusimicrobiales bacterium]